MMRCEADSSHHATHCHLTIVKYRNKRHLPVGALCKRGTQGVQLIEKYAISSFGLKVFVRAVLRAYITLVSSYSFNV